MSTTLTLPSASAALFSRTWRKVFDMSRSWRGCWRCWRRWWWWPRLCQNCVGHGDNGCGDKYGDEHGDKDNYEAGDGDTFANSSSSSLTLSLVTSPSSAYSPILFAGLTIERNIQCNSWYFRWHQTGQFWHKQWNTLYLAQTGSPFM